MCFVNIENGGDPGKITMQWIKRTSPGLISPNKTTQQLKRLVRPPTQHFVADFRLLIQPILFPTSISSFSPLSFLQANKMYSRTYN